MNKTGGEMNTLIVFGYTDGGNYKFHSMDYILKGKLSENENNSLIEHFGEGEDLLIPNQICSEFSNCCPSPYNRPNTTNDEAYDDDIDHPYHKIIKIAETNEKPNVSMSANSFFKKSMTTTYDIENY